MNTNPLIIFFAVFGILILNGTRLNHFENGNPKPTRITAMELLNSHDLPLLLTGSSTYKIYFNIYSNLSIYVRVRLQPSALLQNF